MEELRICKKCGIAKPLSEYYRHSNYYDTKCKECAREYSRIYAQEHSEQIAEYRKSRYVSRNEKNLQSLKQYAKDHNLFEIPEFPNYYADKNGNIYSTRKQGGYRREPTLMTPAEDCCGYLFINCYQNGKRIPQKVHRLIANTFIDNPNDYPIVNHIDGNKLNNAVDNLEWCTCSDNVRHSYLYLERETGGATKPVLLEDLKTNEKFVFESGNTLAKYLDISGDYLMCMLSGKYPKEHWERSNGCHISFWDPTYTRDVKTAQG